MMTTFECLGPAMAWTLTIERLLVVALYLFITQRWIIAARASIGRSARLWRALAWIFRFCAVCGYGLPALAGWFPYWAYMAEAIALPILALFCVAFLHYSKGQILVANRNELLLGTAIKSQTNETSATVDHLQDIDEARRLIDRIGK